MIVDQLQNLSLYFPMHPDMRKAGEFLRAFRKTLGELRRYELTESGLFVNAETYLTKPAQGREGEAHRRYVDLQFVLSGRERIGVAPLETMTPAGDFQQEGDIGFYTGEYTQWAQLSAGDFALIWPHEAHLPGTQWNGESHVVKLVAKLPLP